MSRIINKFNSVCLWMKKAFDSQRKPLYTFFLAYVHAFLIYYCLELGNGNPYLNGVFYTVVNATSVFAVSAFLYLFIQKWWISSLVMSVPLLVLSIANYYTVLFRNSPVSPDDILNMGTAAAVLDGYSFAVTGSIVGLIVVFAMSVGLVIKMRRLEKNKKFRWVRIVIKDICLVFCFVNFFNNIYFSEDSLKPKKTVLWSWEYAYYNYGYLASSIEVFQTSIDKVTKPENYDEKTLEKRVLANNLINTAKGNRTPDIILILNETFYDMRDIVDMGNTPSVMPFIDSLPESSKGRVVVPGTGGGTNKSEYELLTGNSIQLMPGITPFLYLNFNEANSIVSYLESLGYSTWGAHCALASNYSRDVVYPKLGFDSVLFQEDFDTRERYSNRPFATDEFCYEKLFEDYEKMGDGPRFMYMLTIQNHGSWNSNAPEEDLVKVEGDFGEFNDEVNEYQSCIMMSDEAFKGMTEYFEKSDRDVVVCMVGDHSPSIAQSFLGDIDLNETFALRSTPYVVWSNFKKDFKVPAETSMPYLSSIILETAECKMSPFYGYMSELRREVPVVTAFNMFKNADGEVYKYTDSTPYKADIETYFELVYNNTGDDANRIQGLFEAK